MKKLAIFGLALVLVFGMSAVSFAELASDSVGVNVTVAKYAEVAFDNSADWDLTLDNPEDSHNTTLGYTVSTNTPINVNVDGDFTQAQLDLITDLNTNDTSETTSVQFAKGSNAAAGTLYLEAAYASDANWTQLTANDGDTDSPYTATVTLTVTPQE